MQAPAPTQPTHFFFKNITDIITALNSENPYKANELFTSLMPPEGEHAQFNKYPVIMEVAFNLMHSITIDEEITNIKELYKNFFCH